MTKNVRRLFLHVIPMVLVFIYNCGTEPNPTQAGSETTSGVEIAAQGTTISLATTPNAKISIFDIRYNLQDTPMVVMDSAIADESGRAAFENLSSGKYNVFVFRDDSLLGASVLGVPVVKNSQIMYADTETFSPLRTITGKVMRQGIAVSSLQVFIAGSPYNSRTDFQGEFSFTEAPAGDYSIKVREVVRGGYSLDSVAVKVPATGNSIVNVNVNLE